MNRQPLRSIAIFLIACVPFTSPANAALTHSFTPDQAYLDHAAAIGGSTLSFWDSDGMGGYNFGATGVYLGHGWVLGSAHQAFSVDPAFATTPGSFQFATGNNYLTNPGTFHTVLETYIHPSYNGLGNGYDNALYRLAAPLQGVQAANLYTGAINAGMDAHITGFGLTGQIGVTFPAFADGNLRAGVNVINQAVNPSFGFPYFSAGVVNGGTRLRELGFLGLPGDSGGGWFIDVNGELQLAGITSASNATANTHRYGFTTVASRLDIDWINATRTTAVPEPGTFVLFAVGSSLLALRRRRSAVAANSHQLASTAA